MKQMSKNANAPKSYASKTDVGSVREHNEDSMLAQSPLFVVADGMGGHEAGEVASAIAIQRMSELAPHELDSDLLCNAVSQANAAILQAAQDGTGRPGMGTTLTAALICDNRALIAQVGDSRAYLLHEGKLKRITRDHSLVADLIEQGRLTEEEARVHPQRSVITRALGSDSEMPPDVYDVSLEDGDRLMLCSDGLCGMITDDSIAAILVTNPDPSECCNALINEAIAAGGLDNVTVIVVDIEGQAAPTQDDGQEEEAKPQQAPAKKVAPSPNAATAVMQQERKERRKSRRAPIIWALAFVLVIAAASGGFYSYAQNSYYLIEEEGYVCIYRGLPGEIAGVSFSWLEQKTDIPADKLPPTTASRLENGISVDSLEIANETIAQYQNTVASAEPSQPSQTNAAANQ